MTLVPAKCTQCGATIKIDNSSDAGICEFCGTAFVAEKAIKNYNTFITNNYSGVNIDNCLKLAETSLNTGNGKEAIEHINKALEVDPENSHAWFLKMKSVEYVEKLGNLQTIEVISYSNKAIEYSEDKDTTKADVYKYFISRSQALLGIAEMHLKNTEQLQQLIKISPMAAQSIANGDSASRALYLNLISSALVFKICIPTDYISGDESMQNEIVNLGNLLIAAYKADEQRTHIYFHEPNESIIADRKADVIKVKEGLPPEKASLIHEERLNVEESGGCYIATCVYGSYNCPEVWVLRRYRDYALDLTWYGRLFIKCYYAISPIIVRLFGNTKWFKSFWRNKLDKMVSDLKQKGFKDFPYQDKY